jgi:NAD-specific glutamate dehydrogenase
MMLRITQVIRRLTRWLLNHYRHNLNVSYVVKKFKEPVQAFYSCIPSLVSGETKLHLDQKINEYKAAQASKEISTKMASIDKAFAAFDVIEPALNHGLDTLEVARCFFVLDNELSLIWLRDQINSQTANDHWENLALSGLRDQLDYLQGKLAVNVLQNAKSKKTNADYYLALQERFSKVIQRWQSMMANLKNDSEKNMIKLFVALKELSDLVNITTLGKQSKK